MAEVKDILLDDDLDLMIRNGDFVTGPSDQQHIQLILLTENGGFRQSPVTGVGIAKNMNAPVTIQTVEAFKQNIKKQLVYDGYDTKVEVQMTGFNNIEIDAIR